MVEPSIAELYGEEYAEEQEKFEREESLRIARLSKANRTLLSALGSVLEKEINNYENLEALTDESVKKNISGICAIINTYADKPAASLAVNYIVFENDNLTYETLKQLFIGLYQSPVGDVSRPREAVAHQMIRLIEKKGVKIDPDDILRLIEATPNHTDRSSLFEILVYFKKKDLDLPRIVQLANQSKAEPMAFWSIATVAKRLRLVELIPLLNSMAQNVNDNETKRYLIKATELLERNKLKRRTPADSSNVN